MKYSFIALLLLCSNILSAQTPKGYADSLKKFRADYISTHEVVKGDDKKFLSFYNIDPAYYVTAIFKKENDDSLQMKNTKGGTERFNRYGKATFKLKGKQYTLSIYQSPKLMQDQEYKDYLFLPFTDQTSGEESYGGGRYIDLRLSDINKGKLIIDFNKAYNPYCAYAKGFRCPIPPEENDLPVAIKAGEKTFQKAH